MQGRYEQPTERAAPPMGERILRYLGRRPLETWAFFAVGLFLGAFFG
jgi:hypothetical protein